MPDGQGQTGSFSLVSAQRIEVLRGPFSTLYGNASGGVISVFTEDGTAAPSAWFTASGGNYDDVTLGGKADRNDIERGSTFSPATIRHRGYRDHSAARARRRQREAARRPDRRDTRVTGSAIRSTSPRPRIRSA